MKKYSGSAQLASDMKIPATNLTGLGSGAVLSAMVTPAIYTCAGGLAVDQGKVLTGTGTPIEGLYAAGEVTNCPCPRAWSASGVPLLYSIYSGRQVGKQRFGTVVLEAENEGFGPNSVGNGEKTGHSNRFRCGIEVSSSVLAGRWYRGHRPRG